MQAKQSTSVELGSEGSYKAQQGMTQGPKTWPCPPPLQPPSPPCNPWHPLPPPGQLQVHCVLNSGARAKQQSSGSDMSSYIRRLGLIPTLGLVAGTAWQGQLFQRKHNLMLANIISCLFGQSPTASKTWALSSDRLAVPHTTNWPYLYLMPTDHLDWALYLMRTSRT